MALLDHAKERKLKEAKESYLELQKTINDSKEDASSPFKKFYPALLHISEMESQIIQQDQQLKKYRSYFELQAELQGKPFDINTTLIG